MTFDDAVWGAPHPAPRRWGARETAVAVGIAAVIAGLGGAAIYAATGQSAHGAGPMGSHAFGPPGGPPDGQGGAAETRGPALHGQFVVPATGGGYTTLVIQTGTVTAVSPASVTVRSADGFSQQYAIGAGLRAPAVDDQVTIRAVRDGEGGAVRITEILDPREAPGLPAGMGPMGAAAPR
ncbi:hypothetical protein MPSYJ_24390 [Mycolicibacterium psychrotolerans]|uniref:DUF5666 domain-containing protein n=1 Tax=Mycolicibacterium psychrotolerans TaxID=216929 RepID=A0A7I7M9R4_9MYCO|nr:hypothetical protein MPSYJ_24390 [Mycolicibacterium psychrotolerans]